MNTAGLPTRRSRQSCRGQRSKWQFRGAVLSIPSSTPPTARYNSRELVWDADHSLSSDSFTTPSAESSKPRARGTKATSYSITRLSIILLPFLGVSWLDLIFCPLTRWLPRANAGLGCRMQRVSYFDQDCFLCCSCGWCCHFWTLIFLSWFLGSVSGKCIHEDEESSSSKALFCAYALLTPMLACG
jgi:hypothetical protein